jgi:ABC-type nitrate/sulfonate/bicarbonate transport system permease component
MAYKQQPDDIVLGAAVPAVDLERDVASRDSSPSRSEEKNQLPTMKRPRKKSVDFSYRKKGLILAGSFATFAAIWQAVAYLAGNSAILASPLTVLVTLANMLRAPSEIGGLQNVYAALFETLAVVTLGLSLGIVVGIPVGIVMGRWKRVEGILEPWVSATNSIPVIVLIPGLYFSIGGGLPADVFIGFVLSVFSIIINTHAGVKYMSYALAEVGKTFGASERQFVTKLILPSSLPNIFAGIRIGVGRALLGAVMAEVLLGANHGLGGIMITYEEILNTPSMMATVVLISIVGILLLQAPKIIEKRLFRWKEGERLSRGITK